MHCKTLAQLKRVNRLDKNVLLAMEQTFMTPYLAEGQ